MNKKIFIVLLVGCIGIYAWTSLRPHSEVATVSQQPEQNSPESEVGTAENKRATNEMSTSQSEATAQAETAAVQKLTQDELNNLRNQAKQQQQELDQLVLALNENLENSAERKKIEEKYSKLTEQYNQLALQIVKQAHLQEKEVAAHAQ